MNFLALLFTVSQLFIPFLGNTTGGNFLSPNIKAAWRFEETSGNVSDSSTNGFTLIETNAPTAALGVVGNARGYSASSSGDYFYYASSTNFNFTNGLFSISAWASFDTTTWAVNDMSIISLGDFSGTNFCWALIKDYGSPNDSIYFYYSTNGVFDATKNVRLQITNQFDTAFYHILVRGDGTNLKLTARRIGSSSYMPEATSVMAGPFSPWTAELRIGQLQGSTLHDMGGIIDEVFLWSRYISDCNRDWLYTANLGIFSYPAFNSLTCVSP